MENLDFTAPRAAHTKQVLLFPDNQLLTVLAAAPVPAAGPGDGLLPPLPLLI